MNREQAIKEVQSAPLGEAVERVCGMLRPCIRMIPMSTKVVDVKESRFGGRVLLPQGEAWPQWDPREHFGPLIESTEEEVKRIKAVLQRQGIQDSRRHAQQERWLEWARRLAAEGTRRMNFLARINLNDLAGMQCGLDLPKTGSLSVFYDVEVGPGGWEWSHDGWRLIYSPGGDEADLGGDATAPWKDKSLSMAFSEDWTLPTDMDRFEPGLELDEAYDFLGEQLRGESTDMHHLGGWADEIQRDASPPPSIRQNAEWVLLMQIASDSRQRGTGLGWSWGDSGRLYFWIRQDELAAREFGNVWCGFQQS